LERTVFKHPYCPARADFIEESDVTCHFDITPVTKLPEVNLMPSGLAELSFLKFYLFS
jgi:hypothetical protein